MGRGRGGGLPLFRASEENGRFQKIWFPDLFYYIFKALRLLGGPF